MFSLEDMIVQTAESVRPAERLSVSQSAEKYRKLKSEGAYIGPWLNSEAPYLAEAMDVLTSASHRALVFAGPAQCGKTEILLNWLTHTVICDPMDLMIVEKSQQAARDFSMRRVDRLHRLSTEVGRRLIQRKDADNTYDKQYQSGIIVSLSHPSVNELSGKPIPRVALTDYDRMPEDVGGEGSPFVLAQGRTTTFRNYGMTVAESSPGHMIENPRWLARTKHEAPPTKGILQLYNAGDRRRWYWQCVNCRNAFEPDFNLINYPDSEDIEEAAAMATLRCPYCEIDYSHSPANGLPGKADLNRAGRWLKDGQTWTKEGLIIGEGVRSQTASFWLKGVAAAFSDWRGLVSAYLSAERAYEVNGDEETLKTVVNTKLGLPYTPKAMASERVPEVLKARAIPYGTREAPEVPPGVRFLVATIDIQKNRFIVQVHGVGLGKDVWVIDRFEIKKSKRLDDDKERLWVNPGAYFEDWKLLVEDVLHRSYPLMDGSGRRMSIKNTFCDSGGKEGVTANAYDFVRWLRLGPEKHTTSVQEQGKYEWSPGLVGRFLLLKGASSPRAPRVAINYPDSQRKDRTAGARGEIPVLMINPNMIKDMLDKMLDRTDPGGGRINFPTWLDDKFYVELVVETKDPRKGWINPNGYRNESWDLLVYYLAGSLTKLIALEHINWDNPPGWAEEWDSNDLVFNPAVGVRAFEAKAKAKIDLAELAQALG